MVRRDSRDSSAIQMLSGFPNKLCNKIPPSENLIHQQPQTRHLVVINRNKNRPVLREELLQQDHARIHHAQPLIMPRKILRLLADDGAEPAVDFRGVHLVVVNPALVAGVVGRIDVDAFHLARVFRQQRLEGVEIVPLHDEVSRFRAAVGELRIWLQQAKRHLLVVSDHRVFPDPV